jgi:hypothetical protein
MAAPSVVWEILLLIYDERHLRRTGDHGTYRSPKNLRTHADLRARTRRSGSENTT